MDVELFRCEETMDAPLLIVKADAPHVLLKGISMPENAFEFYNPLEQKIVELLRLVGVELIMEVELTYLNSMSGKQILQLIRKIAAEHPQMKVVWKYNREDDLIRIKGEDLKRICPNIAVELQENPTL